MSLVRLGNQKKSKVNKVEKGLQNVVQDESGNIGRG